MSRLGTAARSSQLLLVCGMLVLVSPLVAQTATSAIEPRGLRVAPAHATPPPAPLFSDHPTDGEIRAARVFSEPVMPVGEQASPEELGSLAEALTAYLARTAGDDESSIAQFLAAYPESPYEASLLLNLGLVRRRVGRLSSARTAYREAWFLTKEQEQLPGTLMAERALAEWAELSTLYGNTDDLDEIFAELGTREVGGAAGQKLKNAREGLGILRNHHEYAVPSAAVALDRFLARAQREYVPDPRLQELHATEQGASLLDVKALAQVVGKALQVQFHESGEIPVPSIALLSVKHFSTVAARDGGRYLLDDPILGGEVWVSERTLLEESTGYFLFDAALEAPSGFREVGDVEAQQHRGKCYPCGPDPNGPKRDQPEAGSDCPRKGRPRKGLATWGIYKLHASLHLTDVPLSYVPPVGPTVEFRLDYNQRETHQPSVFAFSNLGNLWTHDWLTYLEDDPLSLQSPVTHFRQGGGVDIHSGFDSELSSYSRDLVSSAQLVRTSADPVRYELLHPDGSIDVFAQPDGSASSPRRVFRTETIDPQGQKLQFSYDGSLRLTSVADAIGLVTTLSYEHESDPLKITSVTDPFAREAFLVYDSAGRLKRITDVAGLNSDFRYGASDFVTLLSTPYGETRFRGDELYGGGGDRRVEAEDPLGAVERVEWVFNSGAVGATEGDVPLGFAAHNFNLNKWNSFYWTKRAMSLYPGDYSKAELIHWLAMPDGVNASAVPASTKMPLERRIWQSYPGQALLDRLGTQAQPRRIARVRADGTTQAVEFEYNDLGYPTVEVDAMGRSLRRTYATNGIDQVAVHRLKSSAEPMLLESATYNQIHRVLSRTDASGATTSFTFNSRGQTTSKTLPERDGIVENRTWTYSYDQDGYLESITGPASGAEMSFSYDAFGRRHTETSPDGLTLTYSYDALDRLTEIGHSDGTNDSIVYDRLDAVGFRGRDGQWTRYRFDALQRPILALDAEGRAIFETEWLSCSSSCSGNQVSSRLDGRGNRTTWEHDLQGRVIKETLADSAEIEYAYDVAEDLLATRTDARGTVTSYGYWPDGMIKSVTYAEGSGVAATADVSFEYDAVFPRLARMIDGIGTTLYEYVPIETTPALGAGKLASIDGPLNDDTISFTYDEHGRVATFAIDAEENLETREFDALGRLTEVTNLLGTFGYSYDGPTRRVASIALPTDGAAEFAYATGSSDRQLVEILYKESDDDTLARFGYARDAEGTVVSTTFERADASETEETMRYDRTSRLLAHELRSVAPTQELLRRQYFAYDGAGNRIGVQTDNAAVSATFNSRNQLTQFSAGGPLVFAGSIDEPALVWIDGDAAQTTAGGLFSGVAGVSGGTSEVVIEASDFANPPNTRTNVYEVTQASSPTSLTYDSNGNMTTDGEWGFEWDGENRLAAAERETTRVEYSLDGLGRRIRRLVREDSEVVSDTRLIRCGHLLCEERNAQSGAILRRHFAQGTREGAESRYFLVDGLGSVRLSIDAEGNVESQTDLDAYGTALLQVGDAETLGFGGYELDADTGLLETHFRWYSPELGRWLSEDRVDPSDGLNAYEYVRGNPATFVDVDGASSDFPKLLWKYCKKIAHGYHIVHEGEMLWDCLPKFPDCNKNGEVQCKCPNKDRKMGFGLYSRAAKEGLCLAGVRECCLMNLSSCLNRSATFGLLDEPDMPCPIRQEPCRP